MLVLLTRPVPEAMATAAALEARGHVVLRAPMLTIAFRDGPLPPGPFDRLVVTSGNAVAALAHRPDRAGLLNVPLAAVGMRTAAAARALGFRQVLAAGRDVAGLVEAVGRDWPVRRRVLYLAGADHTSDLAAALAPHGHSVTLAIVYDARPASALPAEAGRALADGEVDAVLHYSARTAEAFVEASRGVLSLDAGGPRHLCLSRRVAGPLAAAGARDIRIAARPDEDALLALLDAADHPG